MPRRTAPGLAAVLPLQLAHMGSRSRCNRARNTVFVRLRARARKGPRDGARARQANEVRQGFVRKVLGLVLLQLIVTAGASFAFLYVQPLKVRRARGPPPRHTGL
jgi:hypothetical protein